MKIIILVTLLFMKTICSQTNDTTYIYGDSLNTKNIQIFKNWDYHLGDDSSWALPTFSSVGWQLTDCRVRLIKDSVQANNWSGIGWFRKTIVIDSSLMNKTVGMTLNHYGASEFYINGKLFNTFGKVSEDNKKEIIYYANSKPLIIHFNSGSTYLFAVRYSNHLPLEHGYLYNRFRDSFGFFATLKSLNEALNYYGFTQANSTSLATLFIGIFLSISVIYFLLFLFYSKQKEYLYYTIFTFSIALTFSNTALDNIVSSNLLYFLGFTIILQFIALALFLSVLAFLYQIFYGKMLKLLHYLLAVGIGAYILKLATSYDDTASYIYLAIVFISSIEILRVVYLAIKRKKNNAWVIGAGVSVFVVGILLLIVYVRLIGGQLNNENIIFILLFSIPSSMSIYLARSSSQTNKNLVTQLATVKQLSEEAIEHEKKSAKLETETKLMKAENERKTKELEQARQLQLSMLPKEIPQLPNLDVAVYMKTATEVGGDYYDFRVGLDGTLNIALGDATGHGLQAGTLVTIMKGIFTLEAENSEVLQFFNKSVQAIKEIKLGRLLMAFAFLKIKDNHLSLSNAGVPPVYIYRHNKNEVEEIDNKGMPLGAINNFPYKETKTELNKGDVVFLLSDGFPELSNNSKEVYGYEKVKKTFKEISNGSAEEIIEQLKERAKVWSGGKIPDDDVTFVVIKMR